MVPVHSSDVSGCAMVDKNCLEKSASARWKPLAGSK
jgi:hypothetical protein